MSDFVGFCSRSDAFLNHISQLSTSGCGVTAIANVLLLLGVIDNKTNLTDNYIWEGCILRKRANDSPLPQYLYSRHHAGCTGEELVESLLLFLRVNKISSDIEATFVSYHSLKANSHQFSVVDYLGDKFRQGYLVIATLNLQVLGNDAWHHQLIYGIDTLTRNIYAMNPFETYSEIVFESVLDSPSIMLIRKEDILQRVGRPVVDDSVYDLPHWKLFNIRDQVDNICGNSESMPFVIIPAAYVTGFALFRLNS